MFQFPGFPSYSYVFTARSWPLRSGGFPIRKSAGQSPCPAHRSLSQVVTSFVGSRCQGIRPVLFLAWTLLRNISIPSGSLFWFLSLNYLSLANNCFGCISLFSQKTFFSALLTFRHFKWRNHSFFTLDQQKNLCFLIDLNYLFVLLVSYSVFNEHNLFSVTYLNSDWWAQVDSNHRPRAYQARALTTWAMSPYSGGDEGNRTPDLLLARQALSHLSYTPELPLASWFCSIASILFGFFQV